MKFGKIDNLILFGGGQRLVNFLIEAKDYSNVVYSAPRFLKAKLDDEDISVEAYFKREGIQFYNINRISLDDVQEHLNSNSLGVSFGAPWIFKQNFVDAFEGRLINGHGTRLPKNRGGASFSWQIMRKDRTGCHLFHLIDGGIDTGNIVYSSAYEFPETCLTPGDYKSHHQDTEKIFFRDFLEKVTNDFDFKDIEQDESVSTYYPRLSTDHHGWIDWGWGAEDIVQFIRAFDEPFKGASTFLNGNRVHLKSAKVDFSEGAFHPFMSGIIYRKHSGSLFIAAHDGSVVIESLVDETETDLIEGVRVGTRLETAVTYLDAAKGYRAVYTPAGLKPTLHVK